MSSVGSSSTQLDAEVFTNRIRLGHEYRLLEPHGATIEVVSKSGVASPLYIRKRALSTPYVINAHHIYNTEVLQNRSAEHYYLAVTLCGCFYSLEWREDSDNVTLPAIVQDWQPAPARDGPRGSSVQIFVDAHESHDLRFLRRVRISILSLAAPLPLPPIGHRAMDAWLLTHPLEAALQKKDKRIRELEQRLALEQAKKKARVVEPPLPEAGEAVNTAIFPRQVVPEGGGHAAILIFDQRQCKSLVSVTITVQQGKATYGTMPGESGPNRKYFIERTFSGRVEEVLDDVYDVEYFKGEDGDTVELDVTVKTPSVPQKTGEVRIYFGGGHWVPLLDLSCRRYDRDGTPGDKFTPIHVLAAPSGSGLVWLMWDNENQRPVAAKVGYMNETSIEDEKNVYDQMVEKLGAKKKYLLKVHGYDRIFKVDRGFETDDHHDWIITSVKGLTFRDVLDRPEAEWLPDALSAAKCVPSPSSAPHIFALPHGVPIVEFQAPSVEARVHGGW